MILACSRRESGFPFPTHATSERGVCGGWTVTLYIWEVPYPATHVWQYSILANQGDWFMSQLIALLVVTLPLSDSKQYHLFYLKHQEAAVEEWLFFFWFLVHCVSPFSNTCTFWLCIWRDKGVQIVASIFNMAEKKAKMWLQLLEKDSKYLTWQTLALVKSKKTKDRLTAKNNSNSYEM